MIEITTSLVFLISSLYAGTASAGEADRSSQIKADRSQKTEQVENVKVTNPITLEQYVRGYFTEKSHIGRNRKMRINF